MRLGHYSRPAVLLAMLGITVGLAACGSSDASVSTTVPSAPAVTQPAITVPAATVAPTTVPVATVPAATVPVATVPPATDAPAATAVTLGVSDAQVADLEKQLDDIDQLLAGVDADLKQD